MSSKGPVLLLVAVGRKERDRALDLSPPAQLLVLSGTAFDVYHPDQVYSDSEAEQEPVIDFSSDRESQIEYREHQSDESVEPGHLLHDHCPRRTQRT